MRRPFLPAAVLSLGVAALLGAPPAAAHEGVGQRPATYRLDGDQYVSKFEGIGVDPAERTFYVSETTGGEIHRGDVRTGETEVWLDEGADGRTTARGITTDHRGRVYVAGGPNGIDADRPDLWVYAPDGRLLAALDLGVPDAFLNDVTIGPDGAAYVTNSNAPQVFRVAREHGQWMARVWVDATGTIPTQTGFNLGGIVVSPDRRALVVAQGNVGRLWRFDLRSGAVTPIDTGDVDLTDADGLVLRGSTLTVVRNFSRVLTTLELGRHADSARLLQETPTDPARVFTTAKEARGRLLLVDSRFEEPTPTAPFEVVALPLRP
ncbi:gluconolaconase [Geodermatophilus sabuli]|uniref:Gluconolaconase n=1 Tax=Geodermatophilus sabuli TaxID=1564158 RepID=A0A7K3VX26_9ACTN|nr:SMP-30/gluconolactonase/LRE family protein [Geodermatophilus sabuli]NEK56494.1 gluconolaconase [Geodermatophilus sabuli]